MSSTALVADVDTDIGHAVARRVGRLATLTDGPTEASVAASGTDVRELAW
ncbi:hypothetical protein FraQA3DRAFT_6133 [Frankia sp. QA3]|nr:hypothetical protein FraQA3DRAFT_6133 [Frankia sp. QA3]